MNLALKKQKINLANVVKNSGVELSDRGLRPVGLCPFHTDRTPSFIVYSDEYHCFGCVAHGDVVDFVQRRYNLSFIGALQFLGIATDKKEEIDDSKLIKEIERKKKIEAKRIQRERDLFYTLSVLIRAAHKSGRNVDLLPAWEWYHETLCTDSKEEKQAIIDGLKDWPTIRRNYLFKPDFNYKQWVRSFIYGDEDKRRQHSNLGAGNNVRNFFR